MSDNIEDYEITPNDLGCMGEEENPPGLVEETVAPGETKVLTPKSFEHIPFEVKKRAHKLYETFEKKDMPFENFCVELYALESPKLMQADLAGIIEEKHGRNRRMAANLHDITKHSN